MHLKKILVVRAVGFTWVSGRRQRMANMEVVRECMVEQASRGGRVHGTPIWGAVAVLGAKLAYLYVIIYHGD